MIYKNLGFIMVKEAQALNKTTLYQLPKDTLLPKQEKKQSKILHLFLSPDCFEFSQADLLT